jgi:hypothetical protein
VVRISRDYARAAEQKLAVFIHYLAIAITDKYVSSARDSDATIF